MSTATAEVNTANHSVVSRDKWLAERDMAFPELEIENGSGLSRTEHHSILNGLRKMAGHRPHLNVWPISATFRMLRAMAKLVSRLHGGRASLDGHARNKIMNMPGF